jgi:hypothetical protein
VKNAKELVIIAALSAVVGALVSLPVVILLGRPLFGIIEGAGVGSLIGLAARSAFQFFYQNLGGKAWLGFLSIAAVIALGTVAGAVTLGIRQPPHLGILTLLAEASGLTMAAIGYARYRKLNERLKAVQAASGGEAKEVEIRG